ARSARAARARSQAQGEQTATRPRRPVPTDFIPQGTFPSPVDEPVRIGSLFRWTRNSRLTCALLARLRCLDRDYVSASPSSASRRALGPARARGTDDRDLSPFLCPGARIAPGTRRRVRF